MKIKYNSLKSYHEGEHQGVTFRYTNEAIVDALHQQHVNLLEYVEDQIEVLVRSHNYRHDTPPDFSVRVRITKDIAETDGTISETIHSIHVIKIPRLKDEE